MSEPRRTGLLELLGSSVGCQFVIPVYQRNYTWSADKEVAQYLGDLESVLYGKYKNHFMGIIIYLEKPIDFSSREFSIIDGQQRLTTTFLMLYAIKQLFEKNQENDKVEQLVGQYLTNPYHNDKIKYKLKPLVSDDDVYRCIVENRMDDIHNVDSNVLKNYHYIANYLNGLLLKGFSANDILMALNKLYVVCVPISEEDNAQKIFESINATGVKLTAADLIRNFLLMDLQSDVQEDYYKKYWKKLEDYVSSDSKKLELFFRMFLAIKTYSLVAKNNVYRGFVEWVDIQQITIKDLFDELLEYARCYDLLLNENIKNLDKKMRESVDEFRKVDSDIPLSIVMEFYSMYRKGKISASVLGELISSINSYMIRRSLCDINSQNISRLFPTVLKNVIEKCDEDCVNIVKILNQEMVGNNAGTSGSYMPTDKQMMEFLLNANVYKRPALRIVLDRLELDKNPAPVDLSKLSIEHLMPQTPTEEWLEELDTDMETYLENLHRLGNLTLATKPDNSKMSNLKWEYKNEILKDTAHLTLNIEILSVPKWNLNKIEERTKSLIKRICELYPYPEVSILKSEDSDSVDELTGLHVCEKLVIPKDNVICLKKRSIYKSLDKKNGYVLTSSKMYVQGDREKYWFAYKPKRFNDIEECENQYLVLGCRNKTVTVLKIPRTYFLEHLDNFNVSVDDEGNVEHYHLVIFKEKSGKITMMFSKPSIYEEDITGYLVEEE